MTSTEKQEMLAKLRRWRVAVVAAIEVLPGGDVLPETYGAAYSVRAADGHLHDAANRLSHHIARLEREP